MSWRSGRTQKAKVSEGLQLREEDRCHGAQLGWHPLQMYVWAKSKPAESMVWEAVVCILPGS